MSRSTARRRTRRGAVASFAVTALLTCGAASAGAQDTEVVTDGLANPRGITIGPDGHLYVAQAGKGGAGPCIPGAEGGDICLGATGAITGVDPKTGEQHALVDGLPSHAVQGDTPGNDALGAHDVSFRYGRAWFTVGLGGNAAARALLGEAGAGLGWVYRINKRGTVVRVADLVAYEEANDPDAAQNPDGPDSNPFSIDARSGYGTPIVTDAGGNDLLSVAATGEITTLAVFPFGTAPAPPFLGLPAGTELPVQPVPTGVVHGPDRAAYVGQLTGFPFPPDLANVFRVSGGDVSVFASGFTNVIDVAFGKDGTLYVLEISKAGLLSGEGPGALWRVDADGDTTELAAGELTAPGGLTISDSGDIYVTNHGASATEGQVVRIAAGDGDDD